jgi:hypothetical protein
MKRITAIALLAITNLVMAGNSIAQSHGVRAAVPFDFTVGGKLLPAGTYTIKPSSGSVIVITNRDKPVSALTLVNPDSNKSPGRGKLLFHRYGDQYFLSEILCAGQDMSLALRTSKKEQQLQRQQAALASSSQTFIAAR